MRSLLSAYAQVNNSRRSAIHHASLSLLQVRAAAATVSAGAPRGRQPVRDRGGPGIHAELGVDAPDVVLDRLFRQEQVRGDLAVGVPACDQRHDLEFASGKTEAGLLLGAPAPAPGPGPGSVPQPGVL